MSVEAGDAVVREVCAQAPDKSTGDAAPIARTRWARIDVLVAVTAGLGLLSLLAAGFSWGADGWEFPVGAVLVTTVLAIAGEVAEVNVSLGARRSRFSWSETSLLTGLAVLPIPVLVIVKTVAVLIEQRLRGADWRRAVFNTSVAPLTVYPAAGFFLLSTQAAGVRPGTPGSWPFLAVSGLIAVAESRCWVAGAISASTGSNWLATARDGVPALLANWASNVVVALLMIGVWRYSRTSLLALPLVLIMVWQLHQRQQDRGTEREALTRLAAASAAMPALSLVEMTEEVAKRAADLFAARGVQLRLDEAGDPLPSTAIEPSAGDLGMEVELIGRGGRLGILALDVDQSGHLTRQERDVLTTFANTTAAALETVLAHAAQLHAAQHDTLTGLPNRALLTTNADRMLDRRPRGGFALRDDPARPQRLQERQRHPWPRRRRHVAGGGGARLADSVRSSDCVARLGGDEFVILLDSLERDVDAGRLAATLIDRVSMPVTLDGLRIAVEGSAGVAIFPDDGESVEALLRCADVAMYGAKRRGHSVVHYDSSQDLTSPERLGLLADLQVALDANDQLYLHFQPQLDLRTGQTGNVEALVRWQHPTRGPLSPIEFVPIIEHSALIGPFTVKILDEAVRCCVAWQFDAALHGVGIAVNLSARNLMHRDLPDEVARILARHGLPARKLVLEITETAAMNDTEVCESVLARLRDLGVRLSVDDFGTGYASLTFLRRIDVAEVKLDRAFVADMLEDEAAATIVGATVALAHGLGLTVVAEGVETAEQLAALSLAGCDLAQGYFLSRPVPAELLADGADSRRREGGARGRHRRAAAPPARPPGGAAPPPAAGLLGPGDLDPPGAGRQLIARPGRCGGRVPASPPARLTRSHCAVWRGFRDLRSSWKSLGLAPQGNYSP